jgi:hypothetical protein
MPTNSIPSGGGGGLAPKYQKFTSSGTFTLPDGYGAAKPLLVNIQVIGGGGGGARPPGVYNFVGPNNYDMGGYFGQNLTINGVNNPGASFSSPVNAAGGSGGLCSSQLYLTANLTITVGAAGARGAITNAVITGNQSYYSDFSNAGQPGTGYTTVGGDGGITTAGSLSATGGTGSSGYKPPYLGRGNGVQPINGIANAQTSTAGSGGSPAGQAGGATPLLGTIAGGSANTTPVYGSFGVGGKQGDGATTTGVEGSGAGMESIGGSGAVILTWWQ